MRNLTIPFAAITFLLIVFGVPFGNYSFFQLNYLLSVSAILLVGCILLFITRKFSPSISLLGLSVSFAIFGTTTFILRANGTPLFNDDHSSFIYRLYMLKAKFPNIPFYNPLWNGGVDAREFFPSGVLNFFLLFSPLIYIFPIEKVYSFLIALLIFFVNPIFAAISTNIVCRNLSKKVRDTSTYATALLAILPSITFYKWIFVYGTLGFMTSVIIMPLAFVLLTNLSHTKALNNQKLYGLSTVTLTCLALMWPLGGFVLLPLIPFCLYGMLKSKNRKTLICVGICCCLFTAIWGTIFIKSSPVSKFIKADTQVEKIDKKQENKTSFVTIRGRKNIKKRLVDFVYKSNPLIVTAIILSPLLILSSYANLAILSCIIYLIVIALFGPIYFPKLELNRATIFVSQLALIPTGILIGRSLNHCFSGSKNKLANNFLAIPILGILGIIPALIFNIIHNKTSEVFYFQSAQTYELVDAINEFHTDSGRIIFSGFTLHELNNGHIAPLVGYTDKAMVGSHFYHALWKYTDVIPAQYRQHKRGGVLSYLDQMNITTVITHDRVWKNFYRKQKKKFKKVWKKGRFVMFRRLNYSSNYFLHGSGDLISQKHGAIKVKVNPKELKNIVLKFNFNKFLHSEQCQVVPAEVTEIRTKSGVKVLNKPKLSFIRLKNCTDNLVTIKSVSPFSRIIL